MGHYFISGRTKSFMGVNFNGKIIVVRRDIVDPVYQKIVDDLPGKTNIKIAEQFRFLSKTMIMMNYPSEYISSIEALKDHREAFLFEKSIYDVFAKEFYEKYAKFNTKEIEGFKISWESLTALLKLFLMSSSELTYELIGEGSIIRIAKKPSAITRFFTLTKTGDTVHAFPIRGITYAECDPDKIILYKSGNIFIQLTRGNCYF